MSLEFKLPITNEVPLKIAADISYKRKELFEANMIFENKIYKNFLVRSKMMRQKIATNVIPTYILESEVSLDVKDPSGKLILRVEPTGSDIKSTLSFEMKNKGTNQQVLKVVDVQGMFTRNKASEKSDINYKVDVKYTNFKKTSARLYGDFVATLLKSNIDLKLDFVSDYIKLESPANLKFAYSFDGSKATKSYAELAVIAPSTPIDHNVKLICDFADQGMKIDSLEMQIRTPSTPMDKPYVIKYEMNEDESDTVEYELSVKNFNIDLSKEMNGISKTFIKVDGDNMLRTFQIKTTIKTTKEKGLDFSIELQKNDKDMALLNLKSMFNLDVSKMLSNEIPKQDVNLAVEVRILENGGSMKTMLSLEKSESKNMHVVDFSFETKDIIKFLTRISNLKAKFEKKDDTFNGYFEIVRLGDLRSVKLYSTNKNIRKNGDFIENDIAYEKELSNGDKMSAKGILKYTMKNYLNYEIMINIDNHLRFNWLAQNQDKLITQKITHASLDYDKMESSYMIQVEAPNKSDLKYINFNIEAKRGALDTLDDTNNLDILVKASIKSVRQMDAIPILMSRNADMKLKIKALKIDLSHVSSRNYDMQTKKTTIKSNSDLKFPSILSRDSMARLMQSVDLAVEEVTLEKCLFCHLNKEFKLDYQLNTEGPLADLYNLKKIDLDLVRDIADGNVNYDLKTVLNGGENNFNAKMIADLATGGLKVWKFYVKQDMIQTYYSRILLRDVDVTDCGLETAWDLVKDYSNGKFMIDTSMLVKCENKVLGDFSINLVRTYPKNVESRIWKFQTSKFKLSHKIIDKYQVSVNIEKEPKKRLLVDIITEYGPDKVTALLSYDREVDPVTKVLTKGNYKMMTSMTGPTKFSENCEVNIENSDDYLNNMKCNFENGPNVINYGYNFKSENVKNLLGEKTIRLDVSLPTRVIRVDYKRTKESTNEDESTAFEATTNIYTDFANKPDQVATFSLKRDKIASGNTKTYLMFANKPALTLRQISFELERKRTQNESHFNTDLSYELTNGKKNSIRGNFMIASDFEMFYVNEEYVMDRPSMNLVYKSKFSKKDGKLRLLNIKLGKVLQLNIEKETEENRTISIVFANPDETKYTVESIKTLEDNVFVVKSELKLNNALLSKMTSSFDSANNVLNVEIMPVKVNSNKVYRFNFGMYNEKIANAMVTEEINGSKTIMGTVSAKVITQPNHEHELVFNMKWNRMWEQIKSDILNEPQSRSVSSQYNSYFGDVYSVLDEDFKPIIENVRGTRMILQAEITKFVRLATDFTNSYVPIKYRMINNKMLEVVENTNKTSLLTRYNNLAESIKMLRSFVSSYSKKISKMIPRLPIVTYNPEQLTKNIKPFANDLEISRSMLNSHNLYQFMAEFIDFQKTVGEEIGNFKNSMLRNFDGYSLKGLINKYKYRTLSSYSMVGHIYNRRNVISYNGEVTVLKSKCRYLLAHELRKNQFSVILNHNDSPYIISLSAYGSDLIDISYDKASINNIDINLPYVSANGKVVVSRTYNSICAKVSNDMEICCNKDSKSCSVALTRWYTGKVNGLLGKTNYARENVEEDNWYLESSCKLPNIKLKDPMPEAVQTCYSLFGKHRSAVFRDALTVINLFLGIIFTLEIVKCMLFVLLGSGCRQ